MLLKRDIKNSFGKKVFILLFFLVLFQFWFVFTSGSVDQVRETGEMFYMAVVFSFNFFGSIVALALHYNGISGEREAKFLDLILTSGISKRKAYLSKVIACLTVSGIFAVFYSFAMTLIYWALSRDIGLSLMTFRYTLPIMAFLSVFGLMGLMLSVILRSSRASLVACMIIGGLLMPRLFVMMVDGLGNLLGFSQQVADIVYMISPALIMNALNGYAETSRLLWGLLLLLIYFTTILWTGIKVFVKQDELNYGE